MKATNLETRQRVEELVRLRLDGAELWDIREYAKEKGWEATSESNLYRLMVRADKVIAEQYKNDREELVRQHVARRRNLYGRAVTTGDLRTALSCLQDEAELMGLYPPKKTESALKQERTLSVEVKADVAERVLPYLDALRRLAGRADGGVRQDRPPEPLPAPPADRPAG